MQDESVPAVENNPDLIACGECDLLVRPVEAKEFAHYSALCPRCGAQLYHHSSHSLENILALAFACLVLLVVANSFPVVGLNIQGQHIDTSVLDAALQLWRVDMPEVAVLVLVTTTLTPFLEILGIIWLVLPLMLGRRPPAFAQVFRALQVARPWAMVEVFILGILVALVKLSHLAEVLPGPALLCFAGLMLLLTTISAIIEPRDLWRAWEEARA